MPVRMPGPTISAGRSKSLEQTRSQIGSSGGTTLEMITSVTSLVARCTWVKSAERVSATSSEVCSRCVPMRQWCASAPGFSSR